MRRVAREAAGYLAVSVLALAADIAVLWALVQLLGVHPLPASFLSFCAGLLVSYALSITWVFKHRRLKTRHVEFASFAALGALGLGVNTVVMSVAIQYLGLHYLLAKALAAAFTFFCNFITRRQLLFTPRPGAVE